MPLLSCRKIFFVLPFKAIITSGKSSNEKIVLSLYKGKLRGFDIKFENKDTNFVKLFFMEKLLSTAGNGLTLTNGLYFILAFVSAIKFPYILKSLARMLEPYSTFGIRLCRAGLDI